MEWPTVTRQTLGAPSKAHVPRPLRRSVAGLSWADVAAEEPLRAPLSRRRGQACLLTALAAGYARAARRQQLRQAGRRSGGGEAATIVDVEAEPVLTATEESAASPSSPSASPKPWLLEHLPDRDAPPEGSQELLLRFLAALDQRGVELYPAQEEAVVELFRGNHVVLDTPTGSGKSLVAVAACFHVLGQRGGKRAYYTSPTKALVSEKFFDLCRYFGTDCVGLATGDAAVNTRAPLVCCTAEVLTSIALHEGASADIDCVVMDEFHYYGDAARGAAWEIPLWRLPQAAFLLMSGTLGANAELYSSIEKSTGRHLSLVSSRDRPVPLDFSYSDESVRTTLESLLQQQKLPVYCVHFSQREALETARDLLERPLCEVPEERKEALKRALAGTDFNSPFGEELQKLLHQGIGVHHAGLLPRYRRVVEQLAQAGLLTVVCGTDTLGVGINVPIRSVVLTRLCKFNGQDVSLLQPREFLQIAGRAGRKGYDNRGDVVAVAPEWQVYNRELAERLKRGEAGAKPEWKRPPRGNYKHWTQRTFEELRGKPPAPLRSQFQLSMGHVLCVLHGAAERGGDGAKELEELVDNAQCPWRRKRFWRRQAASLARVLGDFGTSSGEMLREASAHGAESAAAAVDGAAAAAEGVEARSKRSGPAAFLDDSSLFVAEALPLLQESVEPADFHISVLALAEAVCQAPTVLLRGRVGSRDSATPLESLLYRAHSSFRARHPWVSEAALQPKDFAAGLVESNLSCRELVASMSVPDARRAKEGGHDDAAMVAEGALLRYLLDVYRTLQRCVPAEFKTPAVRGVEGCLRRAVAAVDSSLLQEWEYLNARERGEADSAAALPQQAGGMVPAAAEESSKQKAPRTKEELQKRVQRVGAAVDARRRLREEEERRRAASPLGRAKRMGARVWGLLERGFQTVFDVIW